MKKGKKHIYCLLITLVLLIFCGTGMAQATKVESPLAEVKVTVNKILTIMRDQSLAAADKKNIRRQMILAEVEARFNFNEMSMRTMARNWKKLSPQEKKTFEGLFAQLLEDSYTAKIEAYSNEEVVYRKEVVRKNKALVYTAIIKNNQEIPINYKLKISDGKWLVYDVVVEGVSLVRNYRSQFSQIISKEKYAGLIKRMTEKIEKTEAAR